MGDSAAACTWEDFRQPRLGRFISHERLEILELLGHGQDGIVWQVKTGSRTYALKVVSFTESFVIMACS